MQYFLDRFFVLKSILSKIIKIVATRCHILRLKCTKFDFGWGSAADPAAGAYSAPPDPLAGGEGAGCPFSRTPPLLSPFGPRFSRPCLEDFHNISP